MPKVTITFQLPEEKHEHDLMLKAGSLATIIYDFTQLCREKTKYATGEEKDPTWEDIRTEWWRILGEENYDPYSE